MTTINERIQHIINHLYGGNTRQFASNTRINYHTVRNVIGERQSKPSSDMLEAIISSIESISATWLLTGKGEMLKKPENGSINISGSGIVANTGSVGGDISISSSAEISSLRKRVKELEAENDQLKQDKIILQEFVSLLKEKNK